MNLAQAKRGESAPRAVWRIGVLRVVGLLLLVTSGTLAASASPLQDLEHGPELALATTVACQAQGEVCGYGDVLFSYDAPSHGALDYDVELAMTEGAAIDSRSVGPQAALSTGSAIDSPPSFVAPSGLPGGAKPFFDDHGRLTNGTYTIDAPAMAKHKTGDLSSGNSQFGFGFFGVAVVSIHVAEVRFGSEGALLYPVLQHWLSLWPELSV